MRSALAFSGVSRLATATAVTGMTLAIGGLALAPAAGAATPADAPAHAAAASSTTKTSTTTHASKHAHTSQHALVSNADLTRIHHWASTMRRIRACESSGNYRINTGNGYYGAYQFLASTWHGLGYRGLPNQAPPVVQDAAAAKLLTRSGTGPWAGCL